MYSSRRIFIIIIVGVSGMGSHLGLNLLIHLLQLISLIYVHSELQSIQFCELPAIFGELSRRYRGYRDNSCNRGAVLIWAPNRPELNFPPVMCVKVTFQMSHDIFAFTHV